MKNLFFLIFFTLASVAVLAQNSTIDSLKRLGQKPLSNTQKVDIWNELALEYTNQDRQLMREYAEKALYLAQKSKYEKGTMVALYRLGMYFHLENQAMKAHELYQKALPLAQKYQDQEMIFNIQNNQAYLLVERANYEQALKLYHKNLKYPKKNYQAFTYRNISDIYAKQSLWDKNLEVLLKALAIYESLGKEYSIEAAYICDLLGNTYATLGQNQEAEKLYRKALKIRENETDAYEMVNSYETLASFAKKKKDFAEARNYYQQALEIYQNTHNQENQAATFIEIAETFLAENQTQNTEIYFQKALSLENSLNDEWKTYLFEELGIFYTKIKNFEKALFFLQKALELAQKMKNKQTIQEIYEHLGQYFKKNKDIEKAYFYLDSAYQLKSIVFADSLAQKIAEKEIEHKLPSLERKSKNLELKNQVLHKENQLQFYAILLVILFVFVLLFVLFFWNKNKQKNRILAQKEQVIQAQEKVYAYFSSELHDGAKSKIRLAIRQADQDTQEILEDVLEEISFICERTADKQHLALPQRISSFLNRLPQNENELLRTFIRNEAAPWDKLNPKIALHLFRITTEAVNNILTHAQDATYMEIKLDMNAQEIYLYIADDGKGMDEDELHKSMGQGLQNIKNRVELLNGVLKISSLSQDEGTCIEIRIPVNF